MEEEVRFLYSILICFFLAGCAGSTEPFSYFDEGENHLVRLEKVSPSESYSHPADLDLETWKTILRSIVARHPVPLLKRIFIQKNEIIEPAFTPQEVDLLADRFKTALARATQEERVAFFLKYRKDMISAEITSGIVFIKGKEVHFILANHHTDISTERHAVRRDNPLLSYEPESFDLIPQAHQKTKISRLPQGQEEIVIDYRRLTDDKRSVPVRQETGGGIPSPVESQLKERLELLKNLRDESLITEAEYAEKKKELLKSLDLK